MARVLFTNVSIVDGAGGAPFPGEVLVEGAHIGSVARAGKIDPAGAEILDGGGATLMPGLVDGHTHMTYPFSIGRKPVDTVDLNLPDDLGALVTAHNATVLLDAGITSAYSAGGFTETMEVAVRREIEEGWIAGPRFHAAAGVEGVSVSADGQVNIGFAPDVEAIVGFIQRSRALGAKIAKFSLSGPIGLENACMYSDAQLEAAGRAAKDCDIWLSAHARFNPAIRQALRFGWRVIYHVDELDDETFDMMEARRDEIFIGPAIGFLGLALRHGAPARRGKDPQYELEKYRRYAQELLKRGVRVLPFGDYGFAEMPHGGQARDLAYFVEHLGFTPAQAIMAATKWGGELMGMADLGLVKAGFLADLLLVNGDPATDIACLQDPTNLLMVMKGGEYHKAPPARVRPAIAAE